MKKRWISGILAVTMAALSVAGCSSAPQTATSDSTSNGSTIELKYWYSWKDKIAENSQELTEEFNNTIGKEKGIHVTAEYQGTYDELHAKLQSAFVANEEPDVSVMEIASIKTFAQGGVIQPLTGMIAEEDVKDFYPGLMENCYVDKTLYGVPYLRSTPILYYNKTLFQKAGLDPEKAPTTWEELDTVSKALEKAGTKGYGFISDIWIFEALLKSNSGDFTNAEQNKYTFDSEQGISMANYLRDGIKNNNFKYYSGSAAKDSLSTDEMNQRVGMWITSTANLTNILTMAKDNGFEIGTSFIPKNTQNKVPTGGCNLVMTSRLEGDRKEAAAEFINFMTSSESAIHSHIKTGYLPSRQSIGTDSRIVELYEKTPQFKVALEQLQYGSGRPMMESYSEATVIIQEAIDKLMTTDEDIPTVLNETADKCNLLIQ